MEAGKGEHSEFLNSYNGCVLGVSEPRTQLGRTLIRSSPTRQFGGAFVMPQLLDHLPLLSLEVASFLVSTAKIPLLPLQEALIDSPALVDLGNAHILILQQNLWGSCWSHSICQDKSLKT